MLFLFNVYNLHDVPDLWLRKIYCLAGKAIAYDKHMYTCAVGGDGTFENMLGWRECIVFVDLIFSAIIINKIVVLLPFHKIFSISRHCLGHFRRIIDKFTYCFEQFLTLKGYHTKFTGADMSQLKNFSFIGAVYVAIA